MTSPNLDQAAELIAGYMDHTLNETTTNQLLALLETSPEIRRMLAESVLADAVLLESFSRQKQQQQAAQAQWSLQGFNTDDLDRLIAQEKSVKPVRPVIIPDTDEKTTRKKYYFFGPPISNSSHKSQKSKSQKVTSSSKTSNSSTTNASPSTSPSKKDEKLARKKNIFFILRAAAILVFFIWLSWTGSRKESSVIQSGFSTDTYQSIEISEVIDAVWQAETDVFKRGQKISSDKLSLQSGIVKLRTEKGAELLLQGPVNLIVNSPTNVFCEYGTVSALIPPRAVGFELGTPFGKVIDRGTEFATSVDKKGMRLEMVTGKADLVLAEKEPVRIVAGHEVKIDSQWKINMGECRSLSIYFSPREFEKIWQTWFTREEEKKTQQEQEILACPGLLVHFNFNQAEKTRIQNSAAEGKNLISYGTLSACNTDSGSLDKKKSILFKREGCGVEFNLPNQLQSLTMIATIRLDRLVNEGNVFACSQDFLTKPGAFLWQIARDGRLQFQILTDQQNTQRSFDSTPAFSQKYLGTWCTVAVVVNAKKRTITHYMDGKIVSTVPWRNQQSLVAGPVVLGNIGRSVKTSINRNLGGAMETFSLYNRALSSGELKLYSENEEKNDEKN